MDKLCPLCKSPGTDLIFKFYCSNSECKNFNKSEEPFSRNPINKDIEDDFRVVSSDIRERVDMSESYQYIIDVLSKSVSVNPILPDVDWTEIGKKWGEIFKEVLKDKNE